MDQHEREWRDLEFGHWINTGLDGQPHGYRCDGPVTYEKKWWLLPAVGIYDFHLNPDAPLTYILGAQPCEYLHVPYATRLQPDGEFLTDKGSVPAPVHWAYERDRFLVWYLHDPMFLKRHIWMQIQGGPWFKFPVNRMQADMIMFYGIGAQDGNRWDRNFIFSLVHSCGAGVWAKHDAEFASAQ